MKHLKSTLIAILSSAILLACKNQHNKTSLLDYPQNAVVISGQSDTLPFLDTTIVLRNLNSGSSKINFRLNAKVAQKILYKYFEYKGYLLQGNLKTAPTDSDLCVQFDTAYLVNLNKDKYIDAIVRYWLAPCGASGHCFQPHNGMLVSKDGGYVVLNEDFVPVSFLVDSVVNGPGQHPYIYFTEYNCAENQNLRSIKAVILH